MATPTKEAGTPTKEAGTSEKKRVAPVLGLEVVDEIPPAPPSGASRQFHNLLVEVANNHKGDAVKVAHYSSKEGASQVRRAFQNGKRLPPGGNMDNWTFEARRLGEGQGSVLYVQYAADGPDVVAAVSGDNGDEGDED